MSVDRDDRRRRRREAQVWFDGLASELTGCDGVDRSTMFGSEGVRVRGRFVAFVGAEGELIVKVPAARVTELVAAGAGQPVHIGRNPAREWVGIPHEPGAGDTNAWRRLLHEAYAHAT